MSNYQIALKSLTDCKAEITAALTEEKDQSHLLRITNALDRQIQSLALLTGTDTGEKAPESQKLGPATSIAGEKITQPKKVEEKDLDPKEERAALLKKQVEETYKTFLATANEDLLKVDHLVLRGVAKKAGLKVTKDEPKKLNVPFIKEVKEAIQKENAVLDTRIADAQGKYNAAKGVLSQLETEKAPEEQLSKASDAVAEAFGVLETLQKQRG